MLFGMIWQVDYMEVNLEEQDRPGVDLARLFHSGSLPIP